eukprot:366520-Chlamydomonas_euryale.AAC.9
MEITLHVVVPPYLEALLPRVEVQRRELSKVGVGHEHVERLALVDVSAAVGRHVNEHALLDLPNRLVQRLEVVRDVEVLHAAVGGHQLVLHVWVPQTKAVEVVQQVLVDDGELAGEHAAHVDVGRVGLKALVVAEDLRG